MLLVAPALADTVPVRLVTERSAVTGCELLTIVKDSDSDVKDLKAKAAKVGGNTALIVGRTGTDVTVIFTFSRERFVGEVYRCPQG